MASFVELSFWGIVAALALVLRLVPLRRTIVFGLGNLAGLACLAGLRITAAAAIAALAYWGVLRAALWLRREDATSPRIALGATLAVATPCLLFLLNKLGSDWLAFRSWFDSYPAAHAIQQLLVGLAFSYVFLRMIELAHGVLWKGIKLVDPLSTIGYLFPFHMILAGPVSRYEDYLKWNDAPASTETWFVFWTGADHVVTGLIYKYVIAEHLRVLCFGADSRLASHGWIDTAILFVYLFFDFAGYSRMMLGAGTWMGVPTPVNFRSPFAAATITDFFSRWHMSLGSFIQRNIYTPLQIFLVRRWGIRRAMWAGLTALVPAWIFVGLWHRASLGFLVYGLTFAAVVWCEKLARDRVLRQPWSQSPGFQWFGRLAGPVYVFVVVTTMLHLVIGELMPA